MPEQQLSDYEKQYLGFYVSMHPVEKQFVKKQYLGIYQLNSKLINQPILVTMDAIRVIRTKQGQQMAFVELNDGEHTVDGVIFPKVFQSFAELIQENAYYIVWGKFEKRNEKMQMIIQKITPLEQYEEEKKNAVNRIVIRETVPEGLQNQLFSAKSKTTVPVYFYNESSNQFQPIGDIEKNSEQLTQLLKAIEPQHIRLL